MNDFHVWVHTDLPELPQELSIAEKYNSKRQNETGGEESDDVAVIYHVGWTPVQKWRRKMFTLIFYEL